MFVAFITAATFLIFFLFKYNYTKCLWAYMGFSGLLIFGVLGAAIGYELIQALGVPLDILTYTFCVYNFSIVGVLAVFFWPSPLAMRQAYLVAIAAIVAFYFTRIDPHHDSRSEPFENPRSYRRPSDPCIRPQPPSHSKTGRPCSKRKDPECALPFCKAHREKGDGAFRKVPHPLAGLCLVANFDIPKGYKTVFWGTRKRWRDTENKEGGDYAMSFRTNGGVIDPTTHKEGSQLQFMSCPGPNEKMNMRSIGRR